ncbi:MAG: hypothetical protein GX594_17730 [Pirellulaceae bacterium]|nr:hypothetical protein [Pirellulaceae bacterium]
MANDSRKHRRRGFTLLEVILAGMLTAVVMLAVATGLEVQLRAFISGRESVERAQLARVLLHKIADDLRGLAPLQTDDAGGAPTAAPIDDDDEFDDLWEDDWGADFEFLDEEEEPFVADDDSAAVLPPIGLRGELDWLRIDALLPIRSEQPPESGLLPAEESAPQVAGELRSIAYYFIESNALFAEAALQSPEEPRGGLARRELDRIAAVRAAELGQLDDHDQDAPSLAPEVIGMEFRYFDGAEWLESWDSAETGSLPKAVDVRLFFAAKSSRGAIPSSTPATATSGTDETPRVQYRLIVPIPGGGS